MSSARCPALLCRASAYPPVLSIVACLDQLRVKIVTGLFLSHASPMLLHMVRFVVAAGIAAIQGTRTCLGPVQHYRLTLTRALGSRECG